MMKSKEEIEGLGNLYLINETREKVEDDIPEVYTQDDIIKAVAWGYDEGFYDATKWHYPSKGEYPPSGEEVLCWLWGTTPDVGCWNEKDKLWHFDEFEEEDVDCWQNIKPPKEEA